MHRKIIYFLAAVIVYFLSQANLRAETWLKSQWSSSGSVSFFGHIFTIGGNGLDQVFTDGDEFAYQNITGNFEIQAKVYSLTEQSPFTTGNPKAGLMVKQFSATTSDPAYPYNPYVKLAIDRSGEVTFTYIAANGQSKTSVFGQSVTSPDPSHPVWLKLVRSGNTFAGYDSTDNMTWTLVGSVTFPIPSLVEVGMTANGNDPVFNSSGKVIFVDAVLSVSVPQRGPDLRLWLRPDMGITVDGSGLVSGWEDQSGNANHAAQGTVGNQPLFVTSEEVTSEVNGWPVLRFSSSGNDYLSVANHPSLNPAQVSVFAAAKRSTGGTADGIVSKFTGTGTSGYILGASTAASLRFWVGTQTAGAFTPGSWELYNGVFDQTKIYLYKNGTALGTPLAKTTPVVANTAPLYIGTMSGAANRFNGDIAETLVYGAAVSTTLRQDNEAYFHSKYGVGVAPPSTPPVISLPSGTYPMPLQISFTVPAGHIVYVTTDGSAPTESSPVYLDALDLFNTWTYGNQTVTIRAIAVKPGYAPSAEVSGTYSTSSFVAQVPTTGLKLWLRADAGVIESGGAVDEWDDQSGNLNHVFGTSTHRPTLVANAINGILPAIHFTDGSVHTYLSSPASGLASPTISVVAMVRRSAGTAAAVVAEKFTPSTAGYSLQMGNATSRSFYTNSASSAGTDIYGSPAGTDFSVLSGTYDQTTRRLLLNSAALGSGAYATALTTSANPFYIGGRPTTASLDGDIAELFVFDHALTSRESDEIYAYLYQRYLIGATPMADIHSDTNSGTYPDSKTVTLSSSSPSIQYTTDGTDPYWNSPYYTGPITVTSSTVIKAQASEPGFTRSPILTVNITIESGSAYLHDVSNHIDPILWLRADAGVTEASGVVSQWDDQSGNANSAMPVGGSNPTLVTNMLNGQPVIRFSSGKYLSILDNATLNNHPKASIFAVVKRSSGTADAVVVEKFTPSTAGYSMRIGTATTRNFYTNTAAAVSTFTDSAGSPAGTNYGVMEATYDQVTRKFYLNGAQMDSDPYTVAIANSVNPLYIGGRAAASSLDGDIAELLIYPDALSNLARQHVEAYLYLKYGIGTAPTLAAPTANLVSGTYGSNQELILTPPTDGVDIYYTTDTSYPVPGSGSTQLYPGSLTISTSGVNTIRAIATKAGFANSASLDLSINIDTATYLLPAHRPVLWLRADVGVELNGSTVKKWADQSGYGNHASQGTAGNQPSPASSVLNGWPSIRFNTAAIPPASAHNTYLSVADSPSLNPSSVSAFAVIKRSSGSAVAIVLEKYSGSNPVYGLDANSAITRTFYTTTTAVAGATSNLSSPGTSFNLLEGLYDSTASRSLYIDGALATSNSTSLGALSTTTNPLIIGGRSATLNFDGDIMEILVYDKALADSERREVEGYLNGRYGYNGTTGIAINTPADPPVMSVSTGVYSQSQTLTMTATNGGDIYYTNDGVTAPTTSATLYSGPVTVSSSTKFRAITARSGFVPSAEAVSDIVIDLNKGLVPTNGLKVWLRADSGVVQSGGLISQWTDFSMNGNDAIQATSGLRPSLNSTDADLTGSQPSVQFGTGGAKYFKILDPTNTLVPGRMNVFIVMKASGTGSRMILDKLAASVPEGYRLLRSSSTISWQHWVNASTSYGVTGTMPTTQYTLINGYHGSSSRSMFVDGVQQTPSVGTTSAGVNTNPLFIGASYDGSTYYIADKIAAILIYDRSDGLSDVERLRLEAYVKLKYGVGTVPTLPAPTADYAGGTFQSAVDVTLSSATPSTTIYYTVGDDSNPPADPTDMSTAYTGPVTIEGPNKILKAKAYRDGYVSSPVTTWHYTIDENAAIIRDGLVMWLKSDEGVDYDGSNKVRSWLDQSGLGNHVMQPTPGNQPSRVPNVLNGLPVVRFNSVGATYMLANDNPTLNNSQVTIMGVVSRTSGSGTVVVAEKFTPSSAGYSLQMTSAVARLFYTNNGSLSYSVASPGTDFALLTASYDQVSRKIYANGTGATPVSYATALTTVSKPFYLGGRAAASNLDGDVAEVLVYNRGLSSQERQAVEFYLMRKHRLVKPQLTSPVFSIPTGTTLAAPAQVAMYVPQAPAGAAIYYTTDGSTPTTSSSLYTGPITVSYTQTVKALAHVAGYTDSTAVSATYTLDSMAWPGPVVDPGDTTPPVITLDRPTNAVLQ